MGKSLDQWVNGEPGARRLYEDLECHAHGGGPEDFARLAMISIRQWIEDRSSQLVGVGGPHQSIAHHCVVTTNSPCRICGRGAI